MSSNEQGVFKNRGIVLIFHTKHSDVHYLSIVSRIHEVHLTFPCVHRSVNLLHTQRVLVCGGRLLGNAGVSRRQIHARCCRSTVAKAGHHRDRNQQRQPHEMSARRHDASWCVWPGDVIRLGERESERDGIIMLLAALHQTSRTCARWQDGTVRSTAEVSIALAWAGESRRCMAYLSVQVLVDEATF